jgi:hypothetical protein
VRDELANLFTVYQFHLPSEEALCAEIKRELKQLTETEPASPIGT